MSHVRRVVACCGALTLAFSLFAASASAATPASVTSATAAAIWLKTQQQPDGGFERLFPGFETRDAALAIAEQAQTGTTWSTSEARSAVQAVTTNGSPSPLDFLEQDSAVVGAGGSAAKTIVLTTAPLGLDPTSFGSPAAPVNLVTLMGGCSVSEDPAISNLMYILLAEKLACGSISAAGLTNLRSQQQPDGSWAGFDGATLDVDTTALAVETLIAGGADGSDPAVHNALAFFAANHQTDGAWQSFGSDDPNSTSLAILGITAAGYDVESPCWRDTTHPASAGTAYASPTTWLQSQQLTSPPADAGRIQSPNDGFPPITTFATSQTVEGLLQTWLPVTRATAQTCALAPTPTVDTTTPVAGGAITVSGGGFAASTPLTIELHSTPVVLATTTSDVFGNYSATVVIPPDTTPGAHELVVSGLDPNGQPRSVSVAITVAAAGTTPDVPVEVSPVAVAVAGSPRFTG
jgi:hypothetical protein